MNDVGFVEALLDYLQNTYCLDLDRLYATGFSNGGIFSWQLGMSLASRFAAIAPIGGTPLVGFLGAPDLSGGHRIPIMDVHGQRDVTCPPFGGESAYDSVFWDCEGFLYTAASEGTQRFAEAHNCPGGDVVKQTPYDDYVTCYQHGQCQDAVEFTRCLWPGDHYWPQTPLKLDGTRFVWWFFEKHVFIKPAGFDPHAKPPSRFYQTASNGTLLSSAQYAAAIKAYRTSNFTGI